MLARIGVLNPTTIQFAKQMAALRPEAGIELIGPVPSRRLGWGDGRLDASAWAQLGLKIHFSFRPYEALDYARYDVVIETYEALVLEPGWREHCLHYES